MRRCTAPEAASHEYLAAVSDSMRSVFSQGSAQSPGEGMDWQPPPASAQLDASFGSADSGSGGMRHSATWLRLLDGAKEWSKSLLDQTGDASMRSPEPKRRCATRDHAAAGDLTGMRTGTLTPHLHTQPHVPSLWQRQERLADSRKHVKSRVRAGVGGAELSAAARTGDAAAHDQRDEQPEAERYYDIVEPAAALKALEVELEGMVAQCLADGMPPDSRVICDATCLLIKRECDAEVRLRALVRCRADLPCCSRLCGGMTCSRGLHC